MMRSVMYWTALVLLAGCSKAETDTSGGDADTDADADADSDTDADAWDSTGDPTRDADETLTGDLGTGAIVDLAWADDGPLYCWTGNENSNFTGNHVFFVIDKQGEDNVALAVDPVSGVDVSMYMLEFSSTEAIQYPPDINDASRCDAAFDFQTDGNPGDKELFLIQGPGTGDRALLVGIAGANGQTSGAFTMKIWRGNTEGYDGPR